MLPNRRYQAKVIRGLAKTLGNESAHLRRYNVLAKTLGVLGGLAVGITVFASLRIGDHALIWLVIFGCVGGLFIGLSIYFDSSVQQWPVIRRFLNENAIHEAARGNDL